MVVTMGILLSSLMLHTSLVGVRQVSVPLQITSMASFEEPSLGSIQYLPVDGEG